MCFVWRGVLVTDCITALIFREAWNSLGQMTKTVAIDKYLDLVSILDPDWEKSSSLSEEGSGSLDAGSGGTGGGGGGGGRVVSTLAGEVEEAITDSQKTLFDWCKESNIERLAAMVTADNVDLKDEQVAEENCYFV